MRILTRSPTQDVPRPYIQLNTHVFLCFLSGLCVKLLRPFFYAGSGLKDALMSFMIFLIQRVEIKAHNEAEQDQPPFKGNHHSLFTIF
jgi:hypothetical protein